MITAAISGIELIDLISIEDPFSGTAGRGGSLMNASKSSIAASFPIMSAQGGQSQWRWSDKSRGINDMER
jgi:hypothetical protein